MGNAKYLKDLLCVAPGHVNPFALLNDSDKKINLVVD